MLPPRRPAPSRAWALDRGHHPADRSGLRVRGDRRDSFPRQRRDRPYHGDDNPGGLILHCRQPHPAGRGGIGGGGCLAPGRQALPGGGHHDPAGNRAGRGRRNARCPLGAPRREGDLRPATAELFTALAPGLFALEFPDIDITGGVELLAYPASELVEGVFPTGLASAQLPWEGPLAATPYLLGGEEVVIDRLRLDDGGGEIVWHLAGDSEARAVVSAGATYSEVGGAPQAIVAEPDLPLASLVASPTATPVTRFGVVHLFHLDDPDQPTYRSRFWGDPERVVAVEALDLELLVRLYRYAAEPVVIPVSLTVTPED
ncbi:MAG: hypothetical protein ABIJ48_00520 [Actinomycetota bacterium]